MVWDWHQPRRLATRERKVIRIAWYINYLWGTEGWIAVLALFQMVRIILTRDKRGIVLLSFPILYYLFINSICRAQRPHSDACDPLSRFTCRAVFDFRV